MKSLRLSAPAKINLFLEITSKRPDGYHNIETVMQEIGLADEIELRESSALSLEISGADLPADNTNLCWKAAEAIINKFEPGKSVAISLKKNIPAGAGLGGGSSDAAAVIKGLNEMWHLTDNLDDLVGLAAGIGADVPFFLYGKTALCRGIGEIITPIKDACKRRYVLACPQVHSATASVYKHLSLTLETFSSEKILGHIKQNDTNGIGKNLFNRLQKPAFKLYPEIKSLYDTMRGHDFAGVLMSGSGSAVFGLLQDGGDADALAEKLKNEVPPETRFFVV